MKKETHQLLKDVTLTRRQVSIFKLSMLSAGILLTIYLSDYLTKLERLRRILLIIPGIYIGYVYFSPNKKLKK